jgi:hypothetical protein
VRKNTQKKRKENKRRVREGGIGRDAESTTTTSSSSSSLAVYFQQSG